jgi:hypothetical protein
MSQPEPSIIGPDVGDQTRLRPVAPARDLDEFLEFLARLEEVFGRVTRPRPPTAGARFLL